jgi:hypothetical protein
MFGYPRHDPAEVVLIRQKKPVSLYGYETRHFPSAAINGPTFLLRRGAQMLTWTYSKSSLFIHPFSI